MLFSQIEKIPDVSIYTKTRRYTMYKSINWKIKVPLEIHKDLYAPLIRKRMPKIKFRLHHWQYAR